MNEITEREAIIDGVERYIESYKIGGSLVIDTLKSLDTQTCTKKQVDDIIGNTSWTDNKCNVCGKHRDVLLHFKRHYSVDDGFDICKRCIRAGLNYLGDKNEN